MFRLNDNLPVSSDSLPMLTIYLLACMVFAIMGMIWSTLHQLMRERKYIPLAIKYVIVYCLAFCFSACKTRREMSESFKKRRQSGDDMHLLSDEKLFEILILILNRFVFTLFFMFLLVLNLLVVAVSPHM